MRSLILLAFLSSAALAQINNDLCQKFAHQLIYTQHLISDGQNIWSRQGSLISHQKKTFLSLAATSENLWLLQADQLIETDPTGMIITSYSLPEMSTLSWGRRIVTQDSVLYIIRESGVSAFDLKSKSFRWAHQLSDFEGGSAIDGAFDGNYLQVLLAGTRPGGFNGVVTLNQTGERIKSLPLNTARSGILAEQARMHWHQNKLFINNSGWVRTIDKKQLHSHKPIVLGTASTAIKLDARTRLQVSLSGDFFFNQKEFSGCASYGQVINGEVHAAYDLFSFPLPH